jgi:integrase
MPYIKLSEAAKLASVEITYLHKLVKKNELDSYFKMHGNTLRWFVNTDCERFKKLLKRLEPKAPIELAPLPSIAGIKAVDWAEWEAMCVVGQTIVKSECSKATLREYKRYAMQFLKTYSVLTTHTLRAALTAYFERITPDRDYSRARTMLYQSMMTIARYYVYRGYEEEKFIKDIESLRPKKGKRVPNRPCYTMETIVSSIHTIQTGKSKRGNLLYSAYDRVLNPALIAFAFCTGARASEICGVRLQDIDWVNGKVRLFGKNNKERTVGLAPETLATIKTYLAIRNGGRDSAYFWIGEPGSVMTARYLTRRLSRLGKRLGFVFNSHGIRRTAITHMLDIGIPMPHVRDTVGHASLQVTNTYAQPTENQIVASSKRVQLIY